MSPEQEVVLTASSKDLEGRTALVTGGAQGIGLETAKLLAAAGARLAICDLAESGEAALQAVGGTAAYFRCDVSDADAVERTVAAVVERFGTLDILVNNAGIAIDGLLLRLKREDWARTLDINLSGAFYFCKAAARHLLKARSGGRIVNISSVVGEQGNAGQVAYSASKAGLIGLTRSLARELAGRGVTVNAVAPGFIATRMTDDHVQGENRERLVAAIPLGRIGEPRDVADAVRFLCGPGAAYITGQVLRVNGGLYM
ncbi:MAG: 3-oxoacyl-ACP reductase FabG [Proteobacteria bacterium]|nr:3-oxoacyl-ACP reductase FabG [Pseudomonadota bacterium]